MLALVAFALARSLPSDAPARPADRVLDSVAWSEAVPELTRLLSELLQIESVNPPGSELLAVDYLDRVLQAEGIATERVPLDDGRASLIARLPGSGEQAPLCLLSHIDVVPAEADRWSVPPFSGMVKDGFVWGASENPVTSACIDASHNESQLPLKPV